MLRFHLIPPHWKRSNVTPVLKVHQGVKESDWPFLMIPTRALCTAPCFQCWHTQACYPN